ncbi:unnamed protein product [Ectocarpus sp. 4 AP-2014]
MPNQKVDVTLVDKCCVLTAASTRQLQVHFDEEHGVWHLVPPPIAVVVASASDKIDSTSAGGATRLASQQTEKDLETSSTAAEHRLSTSEKASNTSGDERGEGFVGSTSSGKSADQSLLHDDENEETELLLSTSRTSHRRASANGTCLPGSESQPAIEEIDGEGLLGESDAGREAEGTTRNNQMRTTSERFDSIRELAEEETTRFPGNDETENPSAAPVSEMEENMPAGTRSGSRSGKGEQTAVGAEQVHPSSGDTEDMKILPQLVDQNKEEDQKEMEGGCGEEQRNGDGIAPGTAPLELSGGSNNRVLQDTGKPDRLAKPAAVELSTATPEPSANSGGFVVKGSAGRDSKGSNAALCVTWRGKPMMLTEPVLISLKESTIAQTRVELEEKGEMSQRRESMSTGSKRDVTDNPWSSDEDSEPARGLVSQGRSGDRRREATVDTGGKLGPCTREGTADPSAQHNGRYLEEKHAGSSRLDSMENEEEPRAESKDSQRSGAPRHHERKALPMVQRGTPTSSRRPTRQAVFLSEPYLGPPIAACPRAWPAESTNTMASATDGRHGHHAGRSHRAGYSSSASDDLKDKQWAG